MKTESIKILDGVALLKDIPSKNLSKGQVVTVVEQLEDDVFEVELANKKGETISTFAIPAKISCSSNLEPPQFDSKSCSYGQTDCETTSGVRRKSIG